MHTQPHELDGIHGPKPKEELTEFYSLLAKIEPKQRSRAIRLLVENIDSRVWEVALLYVRTCDESKDVG
ncbi:MAG: hypothetical protein IPP19_03375 [Verrucomicrobia bacterium]|nr:hypothetical protein [Verrucomicrobiota bacterium]